MIGPDSDQRAASRRRWRASSPSAPSSSTDYQDAALAERYRARVARMAEVERSKAPGRTGLAEAVARGYHKLLAYKDEYEVARLYREPGLREGAGRAVRGAPRLELLGQRLLERRARIQPPDLVLVLVGQQLVVAARHRLGETRAARRLARSELGDARHARRGSARPAPHPGSRRDACARNATISSSVCGFGAASLAGPIMRSSAVRSCAASRPKRKALRFISTAAPLSSIASSIGLGADRHAAELVGVAQQEHVGGDASRRTASPQRRARRCGAAAPCRARSSMARRSAAPGTLRSALRVKSAVVIS